LAAQANGSLGLDAEPIRLLRLMQGGSVSSAMQLFVSTSVPLQKGSFLLIFEEDSFMLVVSHIRTFSSATYILVDLRPGTYH
jgi:hypothetical protein